MNPESRLTMSNVNQFNTIAEKLTKNMHSPIENRIITIDER